jgi:hypothetical protein
MLCGTQQIAGNPALALRMIGRLRRDDEKDPRP